MMIQSRRANWGVPLCPGKSTRRSGPSPTRLCWRQAWRCFIPGSRSASPKVEGWLEQRRIFDSLRNPNVKTRQRIVESLDNRVHRLPDPFCSRRSAIRVSMSASSHAASWQTRTLILGRSFLCSRRPRMTRRSRFATRQLASWGHLARAASEVRAASGSPASPAVQVRSQCIAILYRLLTDRVGNVRAAAAESLGDVGNDATVAAELVAAAGDSDRDVRLAIARSLLRINGPGDRTAAGILTSLVCEREPVGDRSLAFSVLMQASEETRNHALMGLVELLSHADAEVQPDLITCLGDAGPQARVVLPALEKLLSDPEPGTRATAVMTILRIDDQNNPRLNAVMVQMIADKSLPQGWRNDMLIKIKETAPAMLTKATPGLIRQLGDSNTQRPPLRHGTALTHRRGHSRRNAEPGPCSVTDGTPLGKPGAHG